MRHIYRSYIAHAPNRKRNPAKFASAACDYPPAACDYPPSYRLELPNEKGTPTKGVPFILSFGTSLAGAPQGRIQRKGLLTQSA